MNSERDQLIDAAKSFLRAVRHVVLLPDGTLPARVQKSQWIITTGPNSSGTMEFERLTVDSTDIDVKLQTGGFTSNSEYGALVSALERHGVPANSVLHSNAIPLVRQWLELPDPANATDDELMALTADLAKAVVDKVIRTRYLAVVGGISLPSPTLNLEPSLILRDVTEVELWRFGESERDSYPALAWNQLPPTSEDWVMLDIATEHPANGQPSPNSSRALDALIGLTLVTDAAIGVALVGEKANQGFGAMWHRRSGSVYRNGDYWNWMPSARK